MNRKGTVSWGYFIHIHFHFIETSNFFFEWYYEKILQIRVQKCESSISGVNIIKNINKKSVTNKQLNHVLSRRKINIKKDKEMDQFQTILVPSARVVKLDIDMYHSIDKISRNLHTRLVIHIWRKASKLAIEASPCSQRSEPKNGSWQRN